MQIPDRRKLFQKRHHRREEIEAQLRRAQIEDQYSTEDSSSEDEESSEGESDDEESSDGELDQVINEDELEEADESEKEDDESEKEENGLEEDEVELEEEEDELEEENDELEEDCNMSLSENSLSNGSSNHNKSNNISLSTIKIDDSEMSVVCDTTNETLCDNTPIAKNNNVLMNENNSDDDTLQSLNDSNFDMNDQQIQVVEWMITRESQKPYGGIIATDGTTDYKITILMKLLLKSNVPNSYNTQSEGESDLDETIFSKGCTLILCQRSSIDDWIDSIEKNIQPGTLNVWVHYGRNRDISLYDLTQKDIVITTTTLVVAGFRKKENNPFYQINWKRIILDDVKLYNYKQQTSKALCQLLGICHWVFSAPAIINNDDDEAMYSLIKFINYKPLNMFENWKNWIKTNQTVSMYEKLKHILYNDKKIV
ncbi:transcription termination factor 2-like [Melanaphis sacchari]|uniref:Transcription termination factor 2 n=1 Tax=Melanaphis sacchari TaxID=742174 RepID=A0A2H8TXJ1_9HEMI|nr:transcription termination factor 2-like [Melanaphis sacchari]